MTLNAFKWMTLLLISFHSLAADARSSVLKEFEIIQKVKDHFANASGSKIQEDLFEEESETTGSPPPLLTAPELLSLTQNLSPENKEKVFQEALLFPHPESSQLMLHEFTKQKIPLRNLDLLLTLTDPVYKISHAVMSDYFKNAALDSLPYKVAQLCESGDFSKLQTLLAYFPELPEHYGRFAYILLESGKERLTETTKELLQVKKDSTTEAALLEKKVKIEKMLIPAQVLVDHWKKQKQREKFSTSENLTYILHDTSYFHESAEPQNELKAMLNRFEIQKTFTPKPITHGEKKHEI